MNTPTTAMAHHETLAWADAGRTWRLARLDIFRDLTMKDMDGITASAPMREVAAGTLLISPERSNEVLFILKVRRDDVYQLLLSDPRVAARHRLGPSCGGLRGSPRHSTDPRAAR
jgi:hypothetical protein